LITARTAFASFWAGASSASNWAMGRTAVMSPSLPA
jgi:hypothetical protein